MTALAIAPDGRGHVADGALARAHLAGQPEAFARLYERFFARLVALCVRHVVDTAAAEDLAQETLMRALEALGDFDPDCPMWPWLKRIATNLAIDHVRKDRRSMQCGLLDEEELTDYLGMVDDTPPQADDFTDELAERWLIESILVEVPVRQAAALELCYLGGWAHRGAADLLGLGDNAFKQLLFRARRTMADEYVRRRGPCPSHPSRTRDRSGEFSPPFRGEGPPPTMRPGSGHEPSRAAADRYQVVA
ncbi:MAG: RNA polymerase sigma factor [Actinobacteria bacterium]|nr:RNA polymerase sigma factor [Actinomycetota bacterium]